MVTYVDANSSEICYLCVSEILLKFFIENPKSNHVCTQAPNTAHPQAHRSTQARSTQSHFATGMA